MIVYRDELWPESEELLQETADLVGYAIRDGANIRAKASGLLPRWPEFEEVSEARATGGLLNIFYVNDFLVGELAGEYPPYAAVGPSTMPFVNTAAVRLMKQLPDGDPQSRQGRELVAMVESIDALDEATLHQISVSGDGDIRRIIFGGESTDRD